MKNKPPRTYRKKKRALRERETRARIVEAAVDLHRTLGPAATGVKEVAETAGVSRTTVYSHFPTEADLFVACSTHWAEANPFPDPAEWAAIAEPEQRLTTALRQLYGWYEQKQDMLEKVLRDTPVVPALAGVMDALWLPYMEQIVEVMAGGWPHGCGETAQGRGALRLGIDFESWKTLRDAGLDAAEASSLVARMLAGVLLSA